MLSNFRKKFEKYFILRGNDSYIQKYKRKCKKIYTRCNFIFLGPQKGESDIYHNIFFLFNIRHPPHQCPPPPPYFPHPRRPPPHCPLPQFPHPPSSFRGPRRTVEFLVARGVFFRSWCFFHRTWVFFSFFGTFGSIVFLAFPSGALSESGLPSVSASFSAPLWSLSSFPLSPSSVPIRLMK